MFSSALKSFSSNINSNYSISSTPTSTSGPWKIYDGKKKSTGKAVSIFVLDRKSLDSHSGSLGRSSATSIKKSIEEVVERLKKEASSLARLRHPNILELVEPVEETRNGGLQYATETVTASLSGLLQEKDEQERGAGARSSRYVTEDSEGGRHRRELEIDELEIQKGLLQVSKALEFLHDNAGLVHGNLTPDAIFVNAKSDWKISGLAFSSPPDNSTKPTSVQPISLSEILNADPRLPHSVQLNLDYCSPDFVLDSNLNAAADMFSMGLLIIALYNSPHTSPLQTNASISTYRRLFTSQSTIPSASNSFLSSRPIPKDLTSSVLPRLITRRPAQRMTAKEFQESAYFDNILMSTIRFLDALPAKTPTEKAQFMRGLSRVLPSFPRSVLDKKLLPALLEEMKDRELLSLILQNIFKIIELLPSGRRPFTEKIMPRLKEIFILPNPTTTKGPIERDLQKEAGLMVLLDHIKEISGNCSGKEFKDNILPIIHLAIESPTHTIVDAALRSLPVVLPVLDFSTIKNELFPVIASVFTKTSSLGIKVRGLEAFVILCGGSNDPASSNDGLDGIMNSTASKKSSSTALDKYTMQEKIVPLIRAIKTKEPAVAMASLNVLRQVGGVADAEFVAMDILPILWNMSLGPLLDLKQFQGFLELIKSLSSRVEAEQTKKLQELAGTNGNSSQRSDDFMSFGATNAFPSSNGASDGGEIDFERLVKGNNATIGSPNPLDSGWEAGQPSASATSPPPVQSKAPAFSWSTPSPTTTTSFSGNSMASLQTQPGPASRTITPDLSRFDALTPTSTQFSQPLQPQNNFSVPIQPSMNSYNQPKPASTFQAPPTTVNWGAAASNPWASNANSQTNSMTSSIGNLGNSMSNISMNQQRPTLSSPSSFSLPPPPGANSYGVQHNKSSFPPPPPANTYGVQQNKSSGFPPPPAFGAPQQQSSFGKPAPQKSGLDAYESLI